MWTKTPMTALCCLTLVNGLVAQQPPHDQGDGNQPYMDHRFEDAEQYSESFDDPARDAFFPSA
jgi:hypothetical protein